MIIENIIFKVHICYALVFACTEEYFGCLWNSVSYHRVSFSLPRIASQTTDETLRERSLLN